jgi:hypothetical protein
VKNILIYITVLTTVIVFVFSGCDEQKKKEAKIISQNNVSDTTSVVITYSVTGAGSGNIAVTKKGGKVKLELGKDVDGGKNIETRFISDGWIYFYFTTETALQPVKSRISKDHLYLKNFASLADAEEIIARTKKGGNEIVAGFTCDIFESKDGSKFSIYNGKYVLQSSFDGIIITATSVAFNSPVQDKEVEKPAGIDFLELTAGP